MENLNSKYTSKNTQFCLITRKISTFSLAIFEVFFLYHLKGIVVLSLNLKKYFTFDNFS